METTTVYDKKHAIKLILARIPYGELSWTFMREVADDINNGVPVNVILEYLADKEHYYKAKLAKGLERVKSGELNYFSLAYHRFSISVAKSIFTNKVKMCIHVLGSGEGDTVYVLIDELDITKVEEHMYRILLEVTDKISKMSDDEILKKFDRDLDLRIPVGGNVYRPLDYTIDGMTVNISDIGVVTFNGEETTSDNYTPEFIRFCKSYFLRDCSEEYRYYFREDAEDNARKLLNDHVFDTNTFTFSLFESEGDKND